MSQEKRVETLAGFREELVVSHKPNLLSFRGGAPDEAGPCPFIVDQGVGRRQEIVTIQTRDTVPELPGRAAAPKPEC